MAQFKQWEFLIQKTVRKAGSRDTVNIPIPEQVKKLVGTENFVGPGVYWSLRKDNQSIILSNKPLSRDKYQSGIRSKIYDIDNLNEQGGRIRPPKDVADKWRSVPKSDDRVYFLAHERMLSGDIISTHLLTEEQILDLLKNNPDRAPRTVDSAFEVPAFGNDDRQ